MKKAQVTFFIIIGLTLLILAGLIFALVPELITPRQAPGNLHSFIQSCLKQSGERTIHLITIRGGYINPPQTMEINNFNITVLKDDTHNFVPDMNMIKSQIEFQSKEFFIGCIDDFSSFRGDFQIGTPQITADINTNSVFIKLNYSVQVAYKDQLKTYSDFVITIDNIQLPAVFSAANETIEQMIEKGMYNLTLLKSLNIRTKAIDYKDAIIFDFNDNNLVHLVYAVR